MAVMTRWGNNNPLVRRVRQHGSLTTLFRASERTPQQAVNQPAALLLGQWLPASPTTVAPVDLPEPFDETLAQSFADAQDLPRFGTPDLSTAPTTAGVVSTAPVMRQAAADSSRQQAQVQQVAAATPITSLPNAPFVGTALLGTPAPARNQPAQLPSATPSPAAGQPPPTRASLPVVTGTLAPPVTQPGASSPPMRPANPIQRANTTTQNAPSVASSAMRPEVAPLPSTPTTTSTPSLVQPTAQPAPPALSAPGATDSIDDRTWTRLQSAYQKLMAREAERTTQARPSSLQRQPTGTTASMPQQQPARRTQLSESGQTAAPATPPPLTGQSHVALTPSAMTSDPAQHDESRVAPASFHPLPQPDTAHTPGIAAPSTPRALHATVESVPAGELPISQPTTTVQRVNMPLKQPDVSISDPPLSGLPTEAQSDIELVGSSHDVMQLHEVEPEATDIDKEGLSATQALPLQAIWPVQRLVEQSQTSALASMETDDWSRSAEPVSVIAPPPLPETVQRLLTQTETGQPTESKIDVIRPRRPRPVPRPATAGTAEDAPQSPAAATHVAATVQRTADSAGQAVNTLIQTGIGPLPADLWTRLGEPVPTAGQVRALEQIGGERAATQNIQAAGAPTVSPTVTEATSPFRHELSTPDAQPDEIQALGQSIQRSSTTVVGPSPASSEQPAKIEQIKLGNPPLADQSEADQPTLMPTLTTTSSPQISDEFDDGIVQRTETPLSAPEPEVVKRRSGTRRRTTGAARSAPPDAPVPPATMTPTPIVPTARAATAASPPVQRASENNGALDTPLAAQSTMSTFVSNAGNAAPEASVNVDELARQVYSELKRKLAVERERLR